MMLVTLLTYLRLYHLALFVLLFFRRYDVRSIYIFAYNVPGENPYYDNCMDYSRSSEWRRCWLSEIGRSKKHCGWGSIDEDEVALTMRLLSFFI